MSSDAFLDANGVRAQYVTTGSDPATYYIRRDSSHAGGNPDWVVAALQVDSFVRNAGATNLEWAFLTRMSNYSDTGQNVALYAQGNKYAQGQTWGAVIEVQDFQAVEGNPTSGVVGLELDIDANGPDPNNCRIGIDIALRRPSASSTDPDFHGLAVEASYGLRFQYSFDPEHLLRTAIGFYPGMNVGIGLDFSGVNLSSAAIKMEQGHVIQFNNALGSAARQLSYNGGGLQLADASADPPQWLWNDNGSLVVNGTQILGSRQTVTGSRATDAWRVSLMAALATHGLITDATTA